MSGSPHVTFEGFAAPATLRKPGKSTRGVSGSLYLRTTVSKSADAIAVRSTRGKRLTIGSGSTRVQIHVLRYRSVGAVGEWTRATGEWRNTGGAHGSVNLRPRVFRYGFADDATSQIEGRKFIGGVSGSKNRA
jgi:hypothetical protein